jgi:hypothetical protein
MSTPTKAPTPKITPDLLAWQRASYPHVHADRRNLLLHAVSAPAFVLGLAALLGGAVAGRVDLVLAGLGAMVLAVVAQARGHRLEAEPPAPFRSPLDVVARLFVEQLVTFPRYLASGDFGRAWRAAGARAAAPAARRAPSHL